MTKQIKILVTPLDWGLGHTTRCIPIIRYLQKLNCEVLVGAEGIAAQVIANEFPGIQIIHLKGYRIQYAKSRKLFTWRIIRQIPKVISQILYEYRWLNRQHKIHDFDGVISDNRYGVFHKEIPSVFMTHQLLVKTGMGRFFDRLIQKINYGLIQNFKECWIVDDPDLKLAGELANPANLPERAKYVGILSHMRKNEQSRRENGKYILVILSGPEPSRTVFENMLIGQMSKLPMYKFIVAGGKQPELETLNIANWITYHKYLNSEQLFRAINDADLIICRSGYSTLMDLVLLNKSALIVPTPGQTEQEYLGVYLDKRKLFFTVAQQNLDLSLHVPLCFQKGTEHFNYTPRHNLMDNRIMEFINFIIH